MFIYIQIRSKHLKTVDLIDQTCATCKNRGVLKMHFFQNFTWLFGPIAPAGKHATIECGVCKTTLPNKKWTNEIDAIYRKEKKKLKTPAKLWRGLFVLLLLFTLTCFYFYKVFTTPNDYQKILNNKEANLIKVKNFKEGDVLFVSIMEYTKNSAGYVYTLAKVIKIEGNKTTLSKKSEKVDFFKQNDIKLSEVNLSKFNQEIEVKTDAIRMNGILESFNAPSDPTKGRIIGEANVVLK